MAEIKVLKTLSKNIYIWGRFLSIAGVLCLPTANAGIYDGEASVVRELDYGEVLFQFYQAKYFTASVNLLVAKQKDRFREHKQDTELLLGGFYLAYGLHLDAEAIFNKVLAQGAPQYVRTRIWLNLAKARYRKGAFNDAIRALEEIDGDLPEARKDEIQLLMSNLLMALGEYKQAAKILKDLPSDDDNEAFAKYNLAIALYKSEQQILASEYLDEVGRVKSNNTEVKALRDKANLALGFALLSAKESKKARAYFERVRLEGPFSNKALLGLGWTSAMQDDYKEALPPWVELKSRSRTDAAVYESYLAVPYAFEQLKAYSQSLAAYDEAIKVLKEELVNVQYAESTIKDGRIWQQLIGKLDQNENSPVIEIKDLPSVLEVRYISSLIANNQFQEAIINLRDLQYLKLNLKKWRDDMPAFKHILDLRRKTYNERLPKLSPEKGNFRLAAFKKERDVYKNEFDKIVKNNDIKRLATPKEKKLIDRLNNMKNILQRNKSRMEQEQYAKYQRKYNLLKGLMEWDIGSTIKPRQWKIKKQLRSLDKAMEETIAQQKAIERARKAAPRGFKGYDKKFKGYERRIKTLQKSIDSAFEQQKTLVQEILLAELDWLKLRLAEYLDQANYAMARLQDIGSNQ